MILITKSNKDFKKGQLITEGYERKDSQLLISNKPLDKDQYIDLNEALTPQDEKRIREIIKNQLKFLFWQFYTKSNILIGTNLS